MWRDQLFSHRNKAKETEGRRSWKKKNQKKPGVQDKTVGVRNYLSTTLMYSK